LTLQLSRRASEHERARDLAPFLGARCDSALPAALFEFLPVLLSFRTLLAAFPAFLLVLRCFAMLN